MVTLRTVDRPLDHVAVLHMHIKFDNFKLIGISFEFTRKNE